MPLPQVTAAEIHRAASKFEAELATMPEWEKWQSDNAYKYGVRIGDKLYPLKRIIEIATGQSVDTFHGGRESIEYLNKLGFEVEPLRMPGASEIEATLHEFLLEVHPQGATAQDAYQAVAERLHLSETMKNLVRKSTGRRKWDNVVRGARAKLVQAGVIVDDGERGVWRLKDRTEPRWWIEKTIVEGRPDRETGPDCLGKAMWSPHRSRSGGDIYAAMREVQAGDRVIHLIDNGPIAGISIAAGRPRLDFPALSSSEWEGMPCYRVELADFQPLEPKVERHEFLADPKLADQLLAIQQSDAKVFYNSKLELNQGSYITEAPDALLQLIRKVFEAKSGKTLPHFSSIRPGSHMNLMRLRSGIRLFVWMFGNEGFSSPRYLEEERNYKEQLSSEWRGIATREAFEAALKDESSCLSLAQGLGRLLVGQQKHNLLPWRYAEVLKGSWDGERAQTFVRASYALLFPEMEGDHDIDAFNGALADAYRAHLNESAIRSASHCIPSLMLWLSYPESQFYLRPELYSRATATLSPLASVVEGSTMTTEYYRQAVEFVADVGRCLREEGHVPRDTIDVQGFLWVIFSRPKIWLGGKSYGGSENMLPQFIERQVYATRWSARPEVAELLSGLEALTGEERNGRRRRLEALLTSSGERRAILSFFDLTLAKDALVLLKSTYFHQGLKKSILRVYGMGRSGGGYSFDELGHQTPVRWVSEDTFAAEMPAGMYPRVNGTLDVIPIADALDLLAVPVDASRDAEADSDSETEIEPFEEEVTSPPMVRNPVYTIDDFCDETQISRKQVEQWQFNLLRKKQMILQGPPGTGKTFVAERLARLLLSETDGVRDLVQFHPSYSYEDFIEGIRPDIGEDGGAKYRLARGRFAEFCDNAKKSRAPHVLIIDEINRANLSRVFGELMYLLEYRDSEIPLPSGAKLGIPPNVYLIGTMNTADRSIALVDHALRRRFAFVYLQPDYLVLKSHLDAHGLPTESLIQTLEHLNKAIADRHYSIGVSYFLKDGVLLKDRLEGIWRTEIEPYLEEYFYDRPEKAAEFSWDKLREGRLGDWSER